MHALLTDRYQLTMLAAYARAGLSRRRAVFELFVRRLPPSRRYLVACGVGRAVALLRDLSFEHADLGWLAEDAVLGPALATPEVADLFRSLRFSARVFAVPEGRVCFPGEPLVRVEGTLAEAQLVETLLLSIVNHDTRVASKCARIVEAAAGRACFEFGSRRTHELAAVDAARSAYVAGFAGTSNEEAARRHGVPVTGTMAHAFVLAHAADAGEDGEAGAFADFCATFARPSVCLVDTFDTARGVARAIEGARDRLAGVRIDSGDLAAAARDARAQLDAAGLREARVVLSDDLDEYKIEALVAAGVPVDTFGVGTMAVSTPDAPSLGAVYKLVALEDASGRLVAVQKRAGGKGSSAAPKQVFRSEDGPLVDVVGRADESLPGAPLLELVFDGKAPVGDQTAAAARVRFLADRARLGPLLRSLAPRAEGEGFPVTVSPALAAVQAACARDGRVAL